MNREEYINKIAILSSLKDGSLIGMEKAEEFANDIEELQKLGSSITYDDMYNFIMAGRP